MKKYKSIPFQEILVDNGFWDERQRLNADFTLPSVYKQFDKTHRFDAISPPWQHIRVRSHVFYDSDTAKWIEAAAYVLQHHRADYPELENRCDDLINRFYQLQNVHGYVNSFYQRNPVLKFYYRTNHELYCCGHLCEAALAYYRATGKKVLLEVVDRYIDYIILRFTEKKNTGYITPGHEEIELALYRLYEEFGKEKYKKLADFFIEKRGTVREKTYRGMKDNQDQHHVPVRQLTKAEGHAVRAMYLYCAMSDFARIHGDKDMLAACKTLYNDALTKMYVTGGIGSASEGECFTVSYDLPNETAYSESCAAISFAMFCKRMLLNENIRSYADTAERILYNNLLSSVSLDGKSFYYENPLQIRQLSRQRFTSLDIKPRYPVMQRQEVFSCSCCPPNIGRTVASVGTYAFTESEDALILQQFIGCVLTRDAMTVSVRTDFPCSGTVTVQARNYIYPFFVLRVPSWCDSYRLSLDGTERSVQPTDGYISLSVEKDFSLEFVMELRPKYCYAHPNALNNRNCVALTYGPVVYCLEQLDNGDLDNLAVCTDKKFTLCPSSLTPLPEIETDGALLTMEGTYRDEPPKIHPKKLRFIPYFAFANRGITDMKVWIPTSKE